MFGQWIADGPDLVLETVRSSQLISSSHWQLQSSSSYRLDARRGEGGAAEEGAVADARDARGEGDRGEGGAVVVVSSTNSSYDYRQ